MITSPQDVMLVVPYLFIGAGAGIFGHNMGAILNKKAAEKDPNIAKEIKIAQNDERNVMIRNLAKAKAYDMMIFVFGVLMFTFSLLRVSLTVLLLLVAGYLFVVFYGVYYRCKYEKEM